MRVSGQTNEELAVLAKHGDMVARAQLVKQNMDYLYFHAYRLVQKCKTLDVHDLANEGSIGLLRAVGKFDPKCGTLFMTYATWWIRASMTRAITDQDDNIRIPCHINSHIKSGRLDRDWQALSARELTDDEICEELMAMYGWRRDVLEGALRARLRHRSLDAPAMTFTEDDGDPLITRMASHLTPADEDLERNEEILQMRAVVETVRAGLTPRVRKVLDLRLMSDDPHTLEVVGRMLGCTRERVRQIEVQVRSKLSIERRRQLVARQAKEARVGKLVCIRCRGEGHSANECHVGESSMGSTQTQAAIVVERLIAHRRELVEKLDALEKLLPASARKKALEAVLCDLTLLVSFSCPLHPEAKPEQDFAKDGSGCLLCVAERGSEAKAE